MLKKDTLTWLAIGALLFAGIIGMISREMKRQRGRASMERAESAMQVIPATTSGVRLLPMSDAAHPPAPLGVRYPHRQLNQGSAGTVWMTVFDGRFPAGLRQATTEVTFTDNDAEVEWVAGQIDSPSGSQIQLFADARPVQLPADWMPGDAAFPVLAAYSEGFVLGGVWTDSLGASGLSFIGGNHESLSAPVIIARSADWQTWQPPDIRLMPDYSIAMVLRAEAPPRMSGKTREVDSAILGWRFPLDGPVPEPEILMPAIPGQFTERPVLAADSDGNLAVAIGHWGTPQPEGLRGYEMTILLAEGMGEWREVTSPIPNQVNIATAQPQLGREGDSLLLVYAFESNEIASPTAHRIQWVRSTDAGVTWSAPSLLLPDPGPGVRDYPLDLIMGDTTATLLLQRQTPAPERKDSIVVDPPTVAMFAAQWAWGE